MMGGCGETRLSVATWNINCSRSIDGHMFDPWPTIDVEDLDVVCMQEVELTQAEVPAFEAKLFDMGYTSTHIALFSPSPLDKTRSIGTVVASRLPLLSVGTRRLQNPGQLLGRPEFHDKGLVFADFLLPCARRLRVTGLHLFPYHFLNIQDDIDVLRQSWSEVDDELAERAIDPWLILGDFNSQRRAQLLPRVHELGAAGLFRGEATRTDGRSHDDIYVSKSFRLLAAKNLATESDHNVLVALLADPIANGGSTRDLEKTRLR